MRLRYGKREALAPNCRLPFQNSGLVVKAEQCDLLHLQAFVLLLPEFVFGKGQQSNSLSARFNSIVCLPPSVYRIMVTWRVCWRLVSTE